MSDDRIEKVARWLKGNCVEGCDPVEDYIPQARDLLALIDPGEGEADPDLIHLTLTREEADLICDTLEGKTHLLDWMKRDQDAAMCKLQSALSQHTRASL